MAYFDSECLLQSFELRKSIYNCLFLVGLQNFWLMEATSPPNGLSSHLRAISQDVL